MTVVFTTDKPIAPRRSTLSFITADNTAYNRTINAMPSTVNQYTAQLQVTDAMPAGPVQVSLALEDANGNRSDTIVRDTPVAIALPVPPVIDPTVPATIAEEQARDRLRAWDEWVENETQRLFPPPLDTPPIFHDVVISTVLGGIFSEEFGFEFEK